jgi:hypothetical protein
MSKALVAFVDTLCTQILESILRPFLQSRRMRVYQAVYQEQYSCNIVANLPTERRAEMYPGPKLPIQNISWRLCDRRGKLVTLRHPVAKFGIAFTPQCPLSPRPAIECQLSDVPHGRSLARAIPVSCRRRHRSPVSRPRACRGSPRTTGHDFRRALHSASPNWQ